MIRSDYDFREDNFDIFLAPRLTSQLIIFVRVGFFSKMIILNGLFLVIK